MTLENALIYVRRLIKDWHRSNRQVHMDRQLYQIQMQQINRKNQADANLKDFYELFFIDHKLLKTEYENLMRFSDLEKDRKINQFLFR